MTARIFRPSKRATQSGRARTKAWVLTFEPAAAREIEPLMGWTSSSDMNAQIRLTFATKEEAVAYAERHGLPYEVEEPSFENERHGVSYSDNFRSTRTLPWTH